jgi:hypothetical protein
MRNSAVNAKTPSRLNILQGCEIRPTKGWVNPRPSQPETTRNGDWGRVRSRRSAVSGIDIAVLHYTSGEVPEKSINS